MVESLGAFQTVAPIVCCVDLLNKQKARGGDLGLSLVELFLGWTNWAVERSPARQVRKQMLQKAQHNGPKEVVTG